MSKFTTILLVNLVTLKAEAMKELLFIKPTPAYSRVCVFGRACKLLLNMIYSVFSSCLIANKFNLEVDALAVICHYKHVLDLSEMDWL